MPANLDGGGVGSVGSVGDVGDVVEIDTTLSNQRWRMEGGREGGGGRNWTIVADEDACIAHLHIEIGRHFV